RTGGVGGAPRRGAAPLDSLRRVGRRRHRLQRGREKGGRGSPRAPRPRPAPPGGGPARPGGPRPRPRRRPRPPRPPRGRGGRRRGEFAEARRLLRTALNHFDGIADVLEGARTQLEIARTLAAAKDPHQLVVHEYLGALTRAERCRRTQMIRTIEEELRA